MQPIGISGRAAISCFWAIEGVETKLETGAWEEKYGCLLGMASCDLGYRLVVERDSTTQLPIISRYTKYEA